MYRIDSILANLKSPGGNTVWVRPPDRSTLFVFLCQLGGKSRAIPAYVAGLRERIEHEDHHKTSQHPGDFLHFSDDTHLESRSEAFLIDRKVQNLR
jgi:hypothetical protein